MILNQLLLCTIPLCLVFGFVANGHTVSYDEERKCDSEYCKALGLDLLKTYMNIWADPCDDFYEFVCGTWARHHRPLRRGIQKWRNFYLVDELTRNKTYDALVKLQRTMHKAHSVNYVKNFFRECIETEVLEDRGIQPLVDLVDSLIGGWPLLRGSRTGSGRTSMEWPEMYTRVYSRTGLGVVFQFSVDKSLLGLLYRGSNQKQLSIQPGILGLDSFDTLDDEDDLVNYQSYVQSVALHLGASHDDEQLEQDIEKMIELEAKLAELSLGQNMNLDFDSLNEQTNNRIDWLQLINSLLVETNSGLKRFESFDSIRYNKEYLNKIFAILDATPVRVIQNLFGWHLVRKFGFYTTDKFRETIAKYDEKQKNIPAMRSICLDIVNQYWPWATGRVFVDAHFSPRDKTEAQQFVLKLKNSFSDILENTTWLDEDTKQLALGKLSSIQMNVGYPEWIKSDIELDSLYVYLRKIDVKEGKFLETVVQLRAQLKVNQLKELTDSSSGTSNAASWPLNVLDANAYYAYNQHSITIPAAIFQPPFFDKNRPAVMNYGAIGAIIGHEFTHAFDAYGHDLEFSWSAISSRNYRNRTDCLEEEYSSIHDRESGDAIDGKHTLDDNIADNGGMHESFAAFRADELATGQRSNVLSNVKLTADQLFFVSYATNWCSNVPDLEEAVTMEHSPDRYRVNVVLGNSPQFAETFQCPVGSKMNPQHKCTVW